MGAIVMKNLSPLRYTGGKSKLSDLMELLIVNTGHIGGTYIEPFAGGAGIALRLLDKKVVNQIVINDYDKGIYSFWKAILTENKRFIQKIYDTPVTVNEWEKQREIMLNKNKKYSFELGFATFFLNRTNRSGIIKGGIIGGKEQNGIWKIDARYNKNDLIKRIEKIYEYKSKIHIYNKDVNSLITRYIPLYGNNSFVYFDPPYFGKGRELYLNFFNYNDHIRIEEYIRNYVDCDWVITYDDVPEIADIYQNYCMRKFDLSYSVGKKRKASEYIIFKKDIMIPSKKQFNDKNVYINLR